MQILNVEMKAKCFDLESIRHVLKSNDASFRGVDHQCDTYFVCSKGRLKLRQGNIENSLIFYRRENAASLKESNIVMAKIPEDCNIHDVLTSGLDVLVKVRKQREIYFIRNVKFHLDTVDGLGTFVEIEAISDEAFPEANVLHQQANHFLELFKPHLSSMVSVSYSDLLLAKAAEFQGLLQLQATDFLTRLFKQLQEQNLSLEQNVLDHLCYRVSTIAEYQHYKTAFALVGELLVEAEISSRPIAVYRLHKPITYGKRTIKIIELPAPKKNSSYSVGFEHAEFVTDESFEVTLQKHPSLQWDSSHSAKDHNPELRLRLNSNMSIKLHHRALDLIIAQEKRAKEESL